MTEKTLTTENIKPALDALRGELAPWPVVAKKQDRLNTAQLNAANSGITSSLVAQIIANTAAIRALESAITGTGLRALVVSSLPAVGTQGILYIVPVTTYDPETDADVVNYSNEYIWIVAPDAPVTEGYYEQVGQTGIVINNGQLNITVNGTSVGTFTANQSGDTTAAITVPTNADYVDRTTDQTVAGVKTFSSTINGTAAKAIADEDGTSIKTGYVNVAGNQTVTGDKSFTGSNTFNSILPNATNTYSLGSSSYQWSSVYAQSYYYNGTAWGLDKANVWTQNNRIQAFLEMQYLTSGSYSDIRWYDENNVNCCTFRQSVNFLTIGKKYTSKSAWYDGAQILITASGAVIFKGYDGANTQSAAFTYDSFYPEQNNAINLGTSTNKWKTINGYEPSVLGEVYVANEVTIDTTNWLLDGSGWNTLDTSIMSGWVYLAVTNCDADSFILFRRGTNKAKNPTICFHPQHANSGTYYLYALFMVPKNTSCIIAVKTGTNGVLSQALLYPCFGNV